MSKKIKKSITLSEEVWDLACQQGDYLGMSASSYISMCIVNSVQQSKAIEQLGNLSDIISKLERIDSEK